jgi:hypothetical protein
MEATTTIDGRVHEQVERATEIDELTRAPRRTGDEPHERLRKWETEG